MPIDNVYDDGGDNCGVSNEVGVAPATIKGGWSFESRVSFGLGNHQTLVADGSITMPHERDRDVLAVLD